MRHVSEQFLDIFSKLRHVSGHFLEADTLNIRHVSKQFLEFNILGFLIFSPSNFQPDRTADVQSNAGGLNNEGNHPFFSRNPEKKGGFLTCDFYFAKKLAPQAGALCPTASLLAQYWTP